MLEVGDDVGGVPQHVAQHLGDELHGAGDTAHGELLGRVGRHQLVQVVDERPDGEGRHSRVPVLGHQLL